MVSKGIIYYTDNLLDHKIATAVQDQLVKMSISKNMPITSSSLRRMHFGAKNVYFPHLRRGEVTMFKQILGGLENSTSDVVFFCEHDVLYHSSHFEFTPPSDNFFYYNEYFYKTDIKSGYATRHYSVQTNGLCAWRELLISHYRRRVAICEKNAAVAAARSLPDRRGGYKSSMRYEPGNQKTGKIDDTLALTWRSEFPNIDIRHDHNLTAYNKALEDWRNRKYSQGYLETDHIPGWGKVSDLI